MTTAFIIIPGRITKNGKPREIHLVGPLAPVAEQLREMRKQFPKSDEQVFNVQNLRSIWNKACDRLGIRKFDEKTRR